MPTITITFAESAVNDLEDIVRYYSDQKVPDIGTRLVSEIISDTELLATQPEMGRIVPEFEQHFLRELIRPPFRIVYQLSLERISIVRVWRSERLLKLAGEEKS